MQIKKKYLKWGTIAIVLICIVGLYFKGQASTYHYDKEQPPLGNPSSELVIMEFSDLQCPACQLAHPGLKKLIEDHGTRFRFEFYHFPLSTIHPHAMLAAEGAECANDQGKFYEFVDSMFLNQKDMSRQMVFNTAEQLGLDTKQFQKCIETGATRGAIRDDIAKGSSMGVQGTPSFFVDGKYVQQWDYDGLLTAIEEFYQE